MTPDVVDADFVVHDVLLGQLLEETGRNVGHLDTIRELLDGTRGHS